MSSVMNCSIPIFKSGILKGDITHTLYGSLVNGEVDEIVCKVYDPKKAAVKILCNLTLLQH